MRKKYFVIRARLAVIACMAVLCCVILGFAGEIVKAVAVAKITQKHPIYSVETTEKVVSLGINCAWGNEDVPELLNILKKYNVKATFFILGEWCDKYPQSVADIYESGHEIGSHSNTHSDMTKLDDAGIIREIRESKNKLEAITQTPVTLFRTPSGAYNSHVIELIELENMYPIQWDCDSIDYKDPSPETMRDRILKKMRNGSIMLFHSGAKNTPAALPMVIEAVRAKGFEFEPVSKIILPKPYKVDFEGRQRKD